MRSAQRLRLSRTLRLHRHAVRRRAALLRLRPGPRAARADATCPPLPLLPSAAIRAGEGQTAVRARRDRQIWQLYLSRPSSQYKCKRCRLAS